MSKYDKIMMDTAFLFSEQSYCKKRKVGAVLSKDNRILATGYNGTISGKSNECEEDIYTCPYCRHSENKINSLIEIIPHGSSSINTLTMCRHCSHLIKVDDIKVSTKTNKFTIHAEQNVITFCAKEGIPTDGGTLYVTTSPCEQCSKLIIQSGIKRVVYSEEYKNIDGILFLKDCGINVEQIV